MQKADSSSAIVPESTQSSLAFLQDGPLRAPAQGGSNAQAGRRNEARLTGPQPYGTACARSSQALTAHMRPNSRKPSLRVARWLCSPLGQELQWGPAEKSDMIIGPCELALQRSVVGDL